jgi:cob(I)alamin adenosyltransferase
MPGTSPTEVPTHHDHPPRRKADSLVLVNTGDGKGKSTAAFGVIVRGVARGWQVGVVQFIKSGKWRTGEEAVCRDRLGVDWWVIGEGFSWDSTDLTRDQAVAQAAWQHARDVIAAGEHRLVVLDEITYPMNWGWIDTDQVVTALRERPPHVNVVCTGRNAPAGLLEVADTVTSMEKVKHAYDTGVRAQRGIDF